MSEHKCPACKGDQVSEVAHQVGRMTYRQLNCQCGWQGKLPALVDGKPVPDDREPKPTNESATDSPKATPESVDRSRAEIVRRMRRNENPPSQELPPPPTEASPGEQ